MARRLLIVDPGMWSPAGHHLPLNEFLCRRASERRWLPTVATHVNVKGLPSVFLPAFRTGIYGTALDLDTESFRHLLLSWNQAFYDDLLALDAAQPLDQDDRLLVHTLNANIFFGLTAFLHQLGARRPAVHIHFMLEPGFGPGNESLRQVRNEVWHSAATAYRALAGTATQSTESLPLQRVLAAAGIVATVALIPGELHRCNDAPTPMRGRFLYVGTARQEKGISVVADAVEKVLAVAPESSFRFRVPDLDNATAGMLEGHYPRIAVDRSVLTYEDYCAELARSEFSFCYYDPGRYAYRNSNVFWESLSSGARPIICQGTAVVEHCQRFAIGSAVVVPEYSTPALARALIAALSAPRDEHAVSAAQRVADELREQSLELFLGTPGCPSAAIHELGPAAMERPS